VVGRQEALEIRGAERDLVALRALEPGAPSVLGLRWAGFGGREIEQLVHASNRSCERPPWESPGRKIHRLSGVAVGVLDGYSAVNGSGAAIRIVFDDPNDWQWALDLWRSLAPG